ncbi:MAG TPA: ABC transporter substrate-binding protein [Chloroflexota bacterium]
MGLLGIALLLAGCSTGGAAPAAAPPSASAPAQATKITGVFTSFNGDQLPVWLGIDGGIFRQHGIELSMSLLQESPALASLLSGEVQVISGGGVGILSAAAEGSDLVTLSLVNPYFNFVFVAPNRIQSLADVKGKRLGIAPPGGPIWLATRMVLKRAGLDPDKDVTQVSMGVTEQRIVALQSGSIDASLLDIIGGRRLVEGGGFHVLYDLAAQKVPYAGVGTVVKKSWVAANRDIAQRYIDALMEGISRTKRDKAAALATYKKWAKSENDAEAQQTYDYFVPNLLSQPYPKADPFTETVSILAEVNPKVAGVNVGSLIDESFVKDAVARGVGS